MTAFAPCRGCVRRRDCEVKRGALKAIRGLRLTSVRISCDLPFKEDFPPGTRVSVRVWDQATANHEGEVMAEYRPATVLRRATKKRDRLLLVTDVPFHIGEEPKRITTAFPKDVRKLDEPRAEVCDFCGGGLVDDVCDPCDWKDQRAEHLDQVRALTW